MADGGSRRSSILCTLVLALLISCGAGVCVAQSPGSAPISRAYTPQTDPYAGLVADSTVTFIGQDFYRAFMATWRELGMTERYSLSIFERPSARWGSLVWVEFAHRRVFSTFLSPGRRDAVGQAGEQAAQIAYQNVVEADMQRLLFKDPDLGPEEL